MIYTLFDIHCQIKQTPFRIMNHESRITNHESKKQKVIHVSDQMRCIFSFFNEVQKGIVKKY